MGAQAEFIARCLGACGRLQTAVHATPLLWSAGVCSTDESARNLGVTVVANRVHAAGNTQSTFMHREAPLWLAVATRVLRNFLQHLPAQAMTQAVPLERGRLSPLPLKAVHKGCTNLMVCPQDLIRVWVQHLGDISCQRTLSIPSSADRKANPGEGHIALHQFLARFLARIASSNRSRDDTSSRRHWL